MTKINYSSPQDCWGIYLLSVDNIAKNYRTAFVLFAYILALLEPRNISMSYVANTLKFVFGTLPSKSILEWNDIEHFYPEIVAHKLNVAMSSKAGYTKSQGQPIVTGYL